MADSGTRRRSSAGTTARSRWVADPHGPFHARLNHVFATVRLPGREYTATEVAAWVNAHRGRVSAVYILKLRSGEKTHPSAGVLDGLGRYFGVPVEVFRPDSATGTDPAELDGPALSAAVAIRDDELLRATMQQFLALTPRSRTAVVPVITSTLVMHRAGIAIPSPSTEPLDLAPGTTLEDAVRDERVREVLTLLLQLPPETRTAVAGVIGSVVAAEQTQNR